LIGCAELSASDPVKVEGFIPIKSDCETTFPARTTLATCAVSLPKDGGALDLFERFYIVETDKKMRWCLEHGGEYSETP
jgi:hypothetical protein